MAKVLVTGMSGTGKSTALRMLGARGHRVVDADYAGWSHFVTSGDGSREWMWREDAMAELLASHREGHLFVAGCSANQGRFYPAFDRIVLLTAPEAVLLARIAARTENPFGKGPSERTQVLRDLREVEPLLRATSTDVLDSTLPIADVVRRLEAIAGPSATPSRERR